MTICRCDDLSAKRRREKYLTGRLGPAIRIARERGNQALSISASLRIARPGCLIAKAVQRLLSFGNSGAEIVSSRIVDDAHTRNGGRDRLKQMQPFSSSDGSRKGHPVILLPGWLIEATSPIRPDRTSRQRKQSALRSSAGAKALRTTSVTAIMASGASARRSAAAAGKALPAAVGWRQSGCRILTLNQTRVLIAAVNTSMFRWNTGSDAGIGAEHTNSPSTILRASRNGHVAAPPSSVMNSRRLIRSPRR